MKSKWKLAYSTMVGKGGGYIVYRTIHTEGLENDRDPICSTERLVTPIKSKKEAQRIADRLNEAEKEGV